MTGRSSLDLVDEMRAQVGRLEAENDRLRKQVEAVQGYCERRSFTCEGATFEGEVKAENDVKWRVLQLLETGGSTPEPITATDLSDQTGPSS